MIEVQPKYLKDALAIVKDKNRFGPYTNTEILEIAEEVYLPYNYIVDYILPPKNRQHPLLRDILGNLSTKN